jgi:archaellum component FlaG (FlaF/FlaG flagellin family)
MPTQISQPADYKNAKAEAKAAKAYAKAQRPWFKKKRFIFPIALVLIVIGGKAATGGGSDKTTTATTAGSGSSSSASVTTKAAAPKDTTLRIGDKAHDGKFQFVVTGIKSGVPQIGDKYLNTKAQGQFVLVSIVVKNIGNEAQTFDGSSQTLYIGGKKFSADTGAAIYLKDSQSFLNDINPGNQVKGVVVFDVPKTASAFQKIELHDSAFSGGVTVVLSK